MAEEGKKISFGFAKSIKKTVLKNTVQPEQKKVDYIECLDEKSIKVIGGEEKKDEPLVIPLLGSKTWHDRIVNKIDADIFEPKAGKEKVEVKKEEIVEEDIKKVGNSDLSNGNLPSDSNVPIKIKTEPLENDEIKVVTLEEQAAKEIIEDLTSSEKKDTETKLLTLPLTEEESLKGQEQSTLEDYEKIPVDAFGLAMLRGMGWQPGKGIGKNEKIVPAVIPELRPKGMGLGADKQTLQKQITNSKKPEEELKIEKGTFVKIIAGKQGNNYGQIEGFDDDAGRLIVKLALGGKSVSLSEFMVQPVTKSEYSKNAKVLNAKKYEEYKDKEIIECKNEEAKEYKDKDTKEYRGKESTRKRSSSSDDSESSDSDRKNNVGKKKKKRKMQDEEVSKSRKTNSKKSKSRKRHSDSESDSDSDYGKRARRRSRSSSSDTYKSKKSKKSKKHRRHDSSSERSSKKNKKKDKERTKDRKSKDSEYTDRRKHKKRGRSRSR